MLMGEYVMSTTGESVISDDEKIEARAREKKFENKVDANKKASSEYSSEEQKRMREEARELTEQHRLQKEINEQIKRELEEKLNAKEIERRAGKKISDIPLDELVLYLPEEERPAKTFDELIEKAYKDFVKSEGNRSRTYICPAGEPTIGIGHLILARRDLGNVKQVNAWREKYKKLPLVDDNGKPLTDAQKVREFNSLVTAMRNGSYRCSGQTIIHPKLSKLTQKGIDEVFRRDFKHHYDQIVDAGFPIHKYPLSVQISMVHLSFWRGNPGRLKSNITDMNNLENVANGTNKALKKANDAMRKTAENGVDSVKIAYNNYQQNIIPESEISVPESESTKPKNYATGKDKGR